MWKEEQMPKEWNIANILLSYAQYTKRVQRCSVITTEELQS